MPGNEQIAIPRSSVGTHRHVSCVHILPRAGETGLCLRLIFTGCVRNKNTGDANQARHCKNRFDWMARGHAPRPCDAHGRPLGMKLLPAAYGEGWGHDERFDTGPVRKRH